MQRLLRRSWILALCLMFSCFVSAQAPLAAPCNFLRKTGSTASTNGAEIPVFDAASKRVFVVAGPVIEWYNMANNGSLMPGGILPAGFAVANAVPVPNSVAVFNGILAASYAVVTNTTNAQQPGRVTFYDAASGNVLKVVEVGYLPDMICFSADGKKLLTANEGEPNSYSQASSFDPEGSVSIVDLSSGLAGATVQTAGFGAFNGQSASLRAQGVRIFGPNASVAQDLEPEYIALSPDGTQAWVTLQENNAIAVVDLATATVISIKPLGLKDHSKPSVRNVQMFPFSNLPSIGTTITGQSVSLGGFSGLSFEGYAANGNMKFITHTDRGPNGEPTGINRPFYLPAYTPEIVRFEVNRNTGAIVITQRLPLKRSNGSSLTGLPNLTLGSNANLPYNDEVPVNLRNEVIAPLDVLGADLEGVVVTPDGSFWMVDEYRPAIYQFNSSGVMINRFVPSGTAAAAGQPLGTFGQETLPAVIAQRRQNRGFEALAYQDGKLYAFVQSPLRNPATLSNTALNAMQNIRVIEFDPATGTTTRQFLYIMDNAPAVSATDTRADKIGDAVAIGNGEFLVVERDDDAADSDPVSEIQKKIYRFSLSGATDLSALPNLINGKTVDQMTRAELLAAGVAPITKYLHIDLAQTGYNTVEKVEGLALVDRNTIAVLNDNDFGVAGATIDATTGNFTALADAEIPVLGLISVRNNGFDASDRDLTASTGRVNIQHWPVFGMFLPDAIASYQVNGQTYYLTANEGDARDYPGFAEELRVGAAGYVLDPVRFPNATILKQNANLGRLQLTNAAGNLDGDGDFDQIQSLGARSFSIWNSQGEQVYDSGDEMEQITATQVPALFNSEGLAAGFDSRSDNKGPEPEGLTIGQVNGVPYAFIGLERTGDVLVYDISNPLQPKLVQYINTPEDLGVEGLTFVPASQSPTGKPLLITAAEVSRTVTVYEVNIPLITVIEQSGLVANDGAICAGAAVTLSAAGDGPWTWSTGAASSTITVSPSETTTYTVNSCALTDTRTITVNPLPACSITAVPDNSVYTGGVPTNLYLGYGPQKLTLQANLPANGAPYTYTWSGGVLSSYNTASPVFTASAPGTYTFTLTVTNRFGCSSSCNISVTVTNIVVAGTKGKKAYLCHNGKTLEVAIESLPAHMNHPGDRLGRCGDAPGGLLTYQQQAETSEKAGGLRLELRNNPSSTDFELSISSADKSAIELRVTDLQGRLVMAQRIAPHDLVRFGSRFAAGTYIAEILQGQERKVIKLVKN